METAFTPVASLAGGALIGTAAVLLMATLGRVMGATGILAGALLPGSLDQWGWRIAVLVGMVTGPLALALATGSSLTIQVPVSTGALVVGGLLVGIGVTLGAGCTSGHGVCGLARLSRRSLVAVLTFMGTTALTVFLLRHLIGS
ncbi:MAG: YeeE/YedE thiosulfate transporter family protein [Pseudomonadota bacterium]